MTRHFLFFCLIVLAASNSFSQITRNQLGGGDTINTITTSVPFLLISPDARAGGMWDAGVATSADANSIHWNPSKFGFVNKKFGASLSYVPWLRALNITDISLTYFSGFYRINSRHTIATSIRYFWVPNVSDYPVHWQSHFITSLSRFGELNTSCNSPSDEQTGGSRSTKILCGT